MPAISYTVIAILPDEPTRSEYIDWLQAGQVDAVVRAGASTAMIVRVEDPATPLQVETRYVFPDRRAFDLYIARTAPKLQAQGLERFPPSRGVRFERRVGTIA